YVYSGKTAATAFSILRGRKYKRAIVIAPSHSYRLQGLAYGDFDFYKTPLGSISIDKEAVAKIADACDYAINAERVHLNEHSLEVQIPFLQIVQPDIPIVPLICGFVEGDIAERISDALLDFFGGENIWIISSDFTHYGRSFGYVPFSGTDVPEKIRKLDKGAIKKILEIDYNGFCEYMESTGATICGENPIRVLLRTTQKAMKNGAKIVTKNLSYSNSGEMSGDYSHCVSYASIAFNQL
nr:AmmeMemoRadiSam system protein B [Victivallales bacterium]